MRYFWRKAIENTVKVPTSIRGATHITFI